MGITSESFLDLLYNKKLPQIYRDEDKKIGYPLKRYLESLIEGGFCGSIKDIDMLMLLIDPETIPEKFFPYLYESFGLEYFPDIDVSYQRKFLLNIGELVKRRGTFSSVQFLIKVLTGLEAELSFKDDELGIVLLAKTLGQIYSIDTSRHVIRNFIQTQIPYYVSPVISSRVDTQIITSKSYSHSAVGNYKFYKIKSITSSPPVVKADIVNDLLVVAEPTGDLIIPKVSDGLLVWDGVEAVVLENGALTFVKKSET